MKRLTVMLIVFILVSVLLIAGVWTLIEPTYQARAEIRIRPIIPRLVFQTEQNGLIPLYDSYVNTQISIVKSLTVLQRVLDQREVQETQWYKSPRRPLLERWRAKPLTPIDKLTESLSVQPRPTTEIVEVSFVDPAERDAKLIVDAVVDQYIRYVHEKSNATENTLYRQLVDQYDTLRREIQGRETICAALYKSLGTQVPQELVSAKKIRLEETQARLNELRRRVAFLEWERQQDTAMEDANAPAVSGGNLPRQPRHHEDAEWRQRDIAVRTIRYNMAASGLDPNDPEVIRARKDLAFAEELLRLRETQLDEQWRDRAETALANTDPNSHFRPGRAAKYELARVKREEELLQAELQKQEGEFSEFFASAQILEKENNEQQHKRELFEAVRARLDQKNMERNVPGAIEILTPAYVSPKPYKDRRIAWTALALVPAWSLAIVAGLSTGNKKKAAGKEPPAETATTEAKDQ